ncbi:MAG: serpin family protein [Clostridiales bacterium]|nr:serpin family protein [Clostridiales bacterium]
MKRLIALFVILMCATFLSTCAMAKETSGGPVPNDPNKEDTAVASFDQDFLNCIHTQNKKENYVVSPLSFRAALVLAVEGADASTRAQLLGAMGFVSEAEMTEWYAAVMESVDYFEGWVSRQEQIAEEEAQFYPPGEAPEVPVHAYRVLNSVWNNTDRFGEFLPEYVRSITEHYGATADSVSVDQITDAVNHWCDESTAGLIPKISDDLSECAAALVNAVYLKSSWVDEFSEYMTEQEDFADIDGKVIRRDMMKAKDRYRYYEDKETKLISIPLNGGLTFIAVLGDDSDWLADYEAAEYTDVDLWIPKLDTESTFGKETLIQYLMDHGAVDAFDANTADFSRMADYPWYISDILQKAKIKTDEEGLEAAAVTMIVMAEGAALEPEEPQYREFHANVPFRYYIVTTETQLPLVVFAGQEVK